MKVGDIELETVEGGTGPTLLLLHGFDPILARTSFVDLLARRFHVIAPSCPGFGNTKRPDDMRSVFDLVHLHLALLETLPGERVNVLGLSFGGWIAAEMAAACSHRIRKLVLVDALGVRFGDRDATDILDIFNEHPREVARARWREPARWAPEFDRMPDEAIVRHARNLEALCLYGWHPYMHNPHLKRWLWRIKVPTLVLWGAEDGIASPAYGRSYAALIPGARFSLIEGAAHHPELEQPEIFAERVLSFLE